MKEKLLFEETEKDILLNNEWEREWRGMPEFTQEKKEAYATVIIRFDNENDLNDFSKLINQKLTNKTKSIWFPFKSHFRLNKKEWSDES